MPDSIIDNPTAHITGLGDETILGLADWLDNHATVPEGRITDVRKLSGGTQNTMLRFHKGGWSFVLRGPPASQRRHSGETLAREARILAALAATQVPHPRFIAYCADADVLGTPFFIMEAVDGFNAAEGVPAACKARIPAMGLAMVDALVSLGEVDASALGLADLGQGDGFLQRQPSRWQNELNGYLELPGYTRIALPDTRPIADWLEKHFPPANTPGLMHGDFHIANVMFKPDASEVVAIIDWEMCTIGDPLLDLAWLLETWPSPGAPTLFQLPPEQLTPMDDMIRRYREKSTWPLDDLHWYRVLACYKLGIILEGTYARACSGKAPKRVGDMLHGVAVNLITRALQKIQAV